MPAPEQTRKPTHLCKCGRHLVSCVACKVHCGHDAQLLKLPTPPGLLADKYERHTRAAAVLPALQQLPQHGAARQPVGII